MPDAFLTWLFVFVRASALLTAMPIFNGLGIPVALRIALALFASALVTPLLPAPTPPTEWIVFIRMFLTEASVGLLLGFLCRLVFFAAELAGGLIANDMGLSMSTAFNPLGPNSTPLPAMMLFWLATVLFLSLDLHHWVLVGFQRTYSLVPIGGAHVSVELARDVLGQSGRIFIIALQIAAPLMAVSFLVMLVFAVLGRAVPQMNAFQESFAAKTLVGLIGFGLTCTLMSQHIANNLRRLPEDLFRVARLLGPG